MSIRIGHGYDAHRLAVGRKLILGGVEIPYERGLLGHSDADVLTHAVMDAMLGALAMGDIGKLFPDSDEVFRGANSISLLQKVVARVEKAGWRLSNLDTTIVAQAPKLAEYLPRMREILAQAAGCALDQINIKATTEEKMGFTGTGEGICAHAVCLLEKNNT